MGFLRRRSDHGDERGTAEPTPQVLDLNPAELAWLDQVRGSLPGGGGALDPGVIGSLFDDALDAWLAAPAPDRDDPNAVINVVGIAVGDAVCARVPGARWAAVVDAGGTELAIIMPPPAGATVFPTNAVAKRWTDGERGWIPDFIDWLAGRLIEVTAEPSPQVYELASFALAHAVRSIVPEGGPLIPFSLVETAEGRSLQRFVGELSEGIARARDCVRASGALRAAVAWDGYLTTEGRREDALVVEASDAGRPSVVMAHRYAQTWRGARAVGEPLTVDRGTPLL